MTERMRLRQELEQARARTDQFFDLIRPEALYERPIPERHRLVFYLGHVEAFDWNQICRWTLGMTSFHPTFDHLFEAGIDPPVGQPAQDTPSDWPSLREIQAYNQQIRQTIDKHWEEAPKQSFMWPWNID
ncbi:MAG: DinB family protein [Nitrospirales bacterium]|nr:DinB family protein [Nitrospirales bacterium]